MADGFIKIKEDDKENDPEDFLGENRRYKEYRPLENAELFRSFIRTANSEELFDERVKEWVDNHGLLQSGYLEWMKRHGRSHRGSPGNFNPLVVKNLGRESHKARLNQTPISIDLLKREVREARNAADLYLHLYEKDFPAIVAWAENLLEISGGREFDQIENLLWSSVRISPDGAHTLSQSRVMNIATGFQVILTQKVSEVQLALQISEPWDLPISDRKYTPRPRYHCPDLWSAIWLQFYLAVAERLPTRRCANPACQLPFTSKKRSDAKTCSRACRLKVHRERKKGAS